MANAPIVPVQLCRLNPPRDVTMDESRESLTNWMAATENFVARDDGMARFVARGATWDPNQRDNGNYGFVAEGQNTKLRRTAPELAAALERFFTTISGFFPFNFLSRQFQLSTSWASMKQMVYIAFNFQLNSASLLKSEEVLKRSDGENYYIFYQRVLDYFYQHLAGPNINVAGYNTGAGGDAMNLSMNNLIAMLWLDKVDRRLSKLVQIEYGSELRNGTQLVALVSRIANDMPSLLTKLEDGRVNMVSINRVRTGDGDNRRGVKNSFRGGAPSRGGRGRGRGGNRDRGIQQHCSHCKHLAGELDMNVPTNHSPLECPRRRVHVRACTADDQDNFKEDDTEDFFDDEEYEEDYGELPAPGQDIPHVLSFQGLSEKLSEREPSHRTEESNERSLFSGVLSCPATSPTHQCSQPLIFSDWSERHSGKVRSLLSRITSGIPTKAKSPAICVEYNGKALRAIVDTGAELNCIDLQVARDMRIPFKKTSSGVKVPGDKTVALAGVTDADLVISTDFNGRPVPLHLQHAVVVDSLGTDVIIGEPGKQRNHLETHSGSRTVTIRYDGQVLHKPYLSSLRSYGVLRAISPSTFHPGVNHWIEVPQGLSSEGVLLYSPRRDGPAGFNAGFVKVRDGRIQLTNESSIPVSVSRGQIIGEVRSCSQIQNRLPLSCKEKVEQSDQVKEQEPELDQVKKTKEQVVVERKAVGQTQDSFPKEKKIKYQVSKETESSKSLHGEQSLQPGPAENERTKDSKPGVSDQKIRPVSCRKAGSEPDLSNLVKENKFSDDDSIRDFSSSRSGDGVGSGQRNIRGGGGNGSGYSRGSGSGCRDSDKTEKKREERKEALQGDKGAESQKPGIARVVSYPSDGSQYRAFADPDPPTEPGHPFITLDPDNIMTESAKRQITEVSRQFAHIFTRRPGKYNGYYGKVSTAIEFASKPTPNTKVYIPQYSEKQLDAMGNLMDQLVSYGVLQRPEDIGITPIVVSPSLLVPKSDPGEYRLVTDFSSLNKHIRKFASVSPTIAEARSALARKRYFVHLDLANYFFQCGVTREDSQYLGTFHPYKGVLCYVVMPQGKKNASEIGYEILGRIYGDMVADKRMTRQADSLFPQGDTFDELVENYTETLRRADLANLTFKPGKVVVCPLEIVLFGWRLKDSRWTPTEHTTSSLSIATPPTTVKGLRSFLGSFKQFTDCVEKYAVLLHGLEKLVGGRGSAERIEWTPDNLQAFEKAKSATKDVKAVTVPRPTDRLATFSDYSADTRSVGGRLEITRLVDGVEKKFHGGYFSVVLDKFKKHWVPCEAEAAGVRLTLLHFEPYIRENHHNTVHYTDNMPVVQAWRRSMQGQFSASSRISTFLVNLSALSVELMYKPGKMMHSADYSSRNPVPCSESKRCQICKFAGEWQDLGDNSSRIGSVTVKDILEGRSIMPFIQLKSWLGQQLVDSVHNKFKRLVETGQHPDKKKTRGENTVLKSLYKKYQSGEVVIQPDGLVMIKTRDGHFQGKVISVPQHLMSGIAFSIHVRLGHPSKGQLVSLMNRYFYTHGGVAIIQAVVENCVQCKSLQPLPKEFTMDSTEKVETFGTRFAVDVIERKGQKIMVTREKLSQYTWLEIIPDQTTKTFRRCILRTVLPWTHTSGAVIRCDGAAALASLSREAEQEGSVFKQFNITLDVGRPTNPNKNSVAENAVKEAEKEILKYKNNENVLTEEDLVVVAKIMNERIRNRGVAAKELLLRRDLITSQPKNIKDSVMAKEQFQKRIKCNQEAQGRRKIVDSDLEYHVGDVVYIRGQISKHQPREQYLITRFEQDFLIIQKLHSKFGSKEYTVYKNEVMPVNAGSSELFEKVKEIESEMNDEDSSADNAEYDNEVGAEFEVSSSRKENVKTDRAEKRKPGRPKKVPEFNNNNDKKVEETNARPTRASARGAREKWRNNPNLYSILDPVAENRRSYHYRSANTKISCGEDCCESVFAKRLDDEIPDYWWFVPPINYAVMEEEDWTFPELEEWARADGEVLNDVNDPGDAEPVQHHQAIPDIISRAGDQAEPQPVRRVSNLVAANVHDRQQPAQRVDSEMMASSSSSSDNSVWDDARAESSSGSESQPASRHPVTAEEVHLNTVSNLDAVLGQVSRNPSWAEQVEMDLVVNLEQVRNIQPQAEPVNENRSRAEPRRSGRPVRKPDKYQ